MELKLKQSEFAAELSLAMAAVAQKETLPVSGLIHLEAKKDALIITSTNLEFGIRVKVPAEVAKDGVSIVDAARLHGWLTRLPEGEVKLKVGKRISLSSGRSSCNINAVGAASFPAFPTTKAEPVAVKGEYLHKVLSSVAFVVGGFEDARFNFTGTKLEITRDSIAAVGTGNNRMAVAELPLDGTGPAETVSFIVAKKAATEVAKLAAKSEVVRVYGDKNNLFFGFGNRMVWSRQIAGNFPTWRKVLPKEEGQYVATVICDEAESILARAGALSDSSSKRAVLTFSADTITVNITSDGGDGVEFIAAEYNGPETSIGINYSWLIDGLKSAGDSADIRFAGPTSPIEIRGSGSNWYRYIVAPMDLSGKEKAA